MRNLKLGLIAVLCMIIAGLCVLLGYGISGRLGRFGGFNMGSGGSYQLVQEQEFPMEGISAIRVEYTRSGNDVIVYEAEGNSIIIREYANYQAAEGELAQIKSQGGTLTVKGPRRANWLVNVNRHIYTEIYLPAEYAGELKIGTVSGDISVTMDLLLERDLNLASTSGDINTYSQSIKANKVNAATTSGEIRLSTLETNQVNVSSTSGDIRIEKVDAPVSCATTSGEITVAGGEGDRTLSSTSGDIRLEGLSGNVSANTASGEIRVSGDRGCGSMGSTSGDVFFSVAELTGDISVNTASGEVRLEMPGNLSAKFEGNTSSGDINTFFDEDLSFSKKGNHASGTVGSGKYQIRITTTSGDISAVSR